jgi:putative ABC transport system substrate-binding protein
MLSACGLGMPSPGRVGKVRRVAYLSSNQVAPDYGGSSLAAFQQGLRDLGYALNTDLIVEYRSAEGHTERLPGLVAELLNLPVDVLVPDATPAALAARVATTTTPIVFVNVNDPVGQGLVPNLARPGGNVTGVSTLSGALSAKRVELEKETLPNMTRVAVLWRTASPKRSRACIWSQRWSRGFTPTPTATDQGGRHWVRWQPADDDDVGGAIG